jgi:murein DD-endopeptidase MepM/ murein hydrolase activator NlpD
MPQFLLGRAKSAGYNENTIFSPQVQDVLAVKLIEGRGGNSWLSGKMKTEDFMQGLADEWAALPNAYGKFSHPGQSSSLKPEKVKSILSQVKQQSSPPQTPTVTPQTPLSTNFAAVTGTSGASQGDKPLSVPYSPFKPGSGATITSGKGMRWGKPHTGYDLAASPGTPLYAYFPGKVTHIGLDGTPSSAGYGNWVVWKDDMYGAYHFFGHMKDRPPVSVGQTVNQGTLMGTVGSTGQSTGPHLHWEISNNPPKSNGQFTSYEDPGSWLKNHPLKKSDVSPQLAKIPSEKEVTPVAEQPQISSAVSQQQRSIADSVATERMGQQFLFIDDRSSTQQSSVSVGSQKSYGGGVSGQITEFDLLNKFMKQKILLDFNYL